MRLDFRNSIFWFKQNLFRKSVIEEYKTALLHEDFSKNDILNLNWDKRKAIVNFAYDNIKFYKSKYDDMGFHPSLLKNESDWKLVPILEKNDIKSNTSKFINHNLPKKYLRKTTTGGSTGEPLKTFRDKSFPEEIIKWRMLKRWDISPAMDMGMLWRIPEAKAKIRERILNDIIWWPTKRIKIDVSFIDDNSLWNFYKKIKKRSSVYLWGYVGAIEAFANFLQNKNLTMDNVRLVWTTAAPISTAQKLLFQKVFQSKVLDQYACSEIHFVASACPNCGILLVEDDFRHVDIVNPDGNEILDDSFGDILLTDLENKVFPLIKYRVGDRSRRVEHICKSSFPYTTIAPVRGRISDLIRIPGGGVINGEFLTTVFDDYPGIISQFQFHQRTDYTVDIKVVSSSDPQKLDSILSEIISKINSKSGNKLNFVKQIVHSIPSDRGKTRFIKSDIFNSN